MGLTPEQRRNEFGSHSEPYLACARDASDLRPSVSCPDCGHWSGVHPGVMNSALDYCGICRLERHEARWLDRAPAAHCISCGCLYVGSHVCHLRPGFPVVDTREVLP